MAVDYVLLYLTLCFCAQYGAGTEYFTVLEEQDAGTWVGNITRRGKSKYYFSKTNEYFEINPDLATIYTKAKIDREILLKDEFNLVVLSSAPIYATEVTIKIVDINDHAPKFKHSIVNLSISESLVAKTLIPIDSATDPDSGKNTITNYSIVDTYGGSDKFSLELILNLLHLKLKNTLDREIQDSYTLNISALDGGNPKKYGYMILNITVLDTNDNSPLFNPSTFRSDIYENATIGTVIHQAKATDSDIGKNGLIKYSINIYNQEFSADLFHVNSSSGLITLNAKLDYEKKNKYTIHVIAKDSGSPSLDGRATVVVNVKNINDNPPLITSGNTNIVNLKENILHSYFTFFQIKDHDSTVLTFNIIGGNEDDKFKLESFGAGSYFLSLKSKLDREKKSKYVLTFRASDNGNPLLTTDYTLIVNVQDDNDNKPVFKKSIYTGIIQEECSVGSFVGDVSAVDDDLGQNSKITYSILSGNERNWFKISSYSGLITAASDRIDFDILPKPFTLLEISANDSGTPSLHSSIMFNITIQDINDNAPVFNKSVYTLYVNESIAANSLLVSLQATDSDHGTNGKITYKFSYNSERIQSYFEIKKHTGELFLKKSLSFNKDRIFEFLVTAEDGGTPVRYSRTRVTVSVLDVDNFSPIFNPKEYFINVLATNSKGYIDTIKAIDHDFGVFGEVVYSIDSGDCCNSFSINESTGQLSSTSNIQAGLTHKLIIKARNRKQTQAAFATVYVISLENLNSNPVFTRDEYVFNVIENAIGKFIGQVKVLPNSHLSFGIIYTILSGDDWQYFKINRNGEILTKKSLDREQFSKFVLTISARSNTSLSLVTKTRVTIFVDDLNDNSPEFASQYISDYSIKENAIVGSHVLTVNAKDMDAGKNSVLKYSITQPSTEREFEIDRNSGRIFLAKSLMDGKVEKYAINLEISDNGVPSRTTGNTIYVSVTDYNNNYPKFAASSYSVKIMSNMTVNTKFLQVKANDIDFGQNGKVLYRIIGGNVGDTFGVFPSGWLFLKQLSVSKNISYYSLLIEAYDSGTMSKSSRVTASVFVDQNGARQIFKKSSYDISFKENLPSGSTVANVMQNVADNRGMLIFRILHHSMYFELGAQDGVLKSKIILDREKIIQATGSDVIRFLISAEKTQGSSKLVEACVVSLKVIDENDNGPVFKKSIYTATVSEASLSGTSVLKVTAIDLDSDQNNAMRYELQTSISVPFALDESSGVLSVSSAVLNRESKPMYNITVLARDIKNTSLSSVCKVFIYVSDANDNKPEFANKETSIAVSESQKIGSTIFRFTAVDKDEGLNSFVTYSLVDSTNSSIFDINLYSGELYLVKSLDYETKHSHVLSIIASDLGTPSEKAIKSFTVHVLDVNDNYPVFQQEPAIIYISENMPLLTVIGHCSASDADSGSNKLIRYSIIEQKPAVNAFEVDPLTCAISNRITLDREMNELYHIVIKAEDQSASVKQRLSTTKVIKIVVLDLNDNGPSFVPPLGNGFARTSNTGWQAIKVLAVDPDAGVNGTVKYEIVSGLDSACFQIDETNGIVTVKAPLSASKKVFQINVKATDSSIQRRSSTALVTLFVIGAAADALSCPSATQTVNEGVKIGSNLYRAQASSPESSSSLRYFIKGGNTENTFSIDSSTGWISNRRMIDFENGPRIYDLVVNAVELSGVLARTAECRMTFQILDVNDNDPEFNSSIKVLTVMENVDVNSEIYQVSATDKDSGINGQISYSIIGGDTSSVFKIDSNTGKIYLAKELDRENIAEYNLRISASDKGSNSRQKSVTLTVQVGDFNDNVPKFNQSYYSFEVSENTPKNALIGQVLANDKDIHRNGEVYYKLSNGEMDTFSLNEMTGEIRLSGNLDYDVTPNYILEIKASDYGNPSLSSIARVFVNVIDVNDNCPVFTKQNYDVKVPENSISGTLVATVTAKDKDSGNFGIVNYSFQSGNADGNFAVSKNGEIRTLKMLNREKKDVYILQIAGKDQRSSSETRCFSFTTVTVVVDDVNDNAPVFKLPLIVNVSEDINVGSIIYTLNATDADNGINATVIYSMVKPNPFEDIFDVDSSSSIQLKSRLDYESKKNYSFQVTASDQGFPSRTTISNFTVIVFDANDNSPVISEHKPTVSLPENITIGTVIVDFMATDKDSGENARISFAILSGNKNNSFGMDSEAGVLFINKELDHEKQSTYMLEIETKDHGVPQKRGLTTLNVIVSDINDNRPRFHLSSYNVSLVENSSPRSLIQVNASDPDSGVNGVMTYSMKNSIYSKLFTIDGKSGLVSTLKQLDREASKVIQLTIIAADGGSPSLQGMTSLFVNILDENDNYPNVSPLYSKKFIKENLPSNVEVQKLSITDSDYGLNSTLTYELMNNFGRFQLGKSGNFLIISTTTNLDREITESYNLGVTVKDSGTPNLVTNAYVDVIVLDDNDFPPVFSQKKYSFKIQAGSPAQSFVAKLPVTDKDIGENAKFQFAIVGGNKSYFEVEQQSGIITTKLPVLQSATFEIKVQVSDPVKTNFRDIATVFIATATGYPKFSHDNQYTSVSENSPVNSQVMKINASSDEVGPAGKINYFIHSGNIGNAFMIDQHSGLISVGQSLDYERKAIYSLWIEARDSSNPPLSSYIKLVITIINEKDSAPRITAPSEAVVFTEQQGINAFVTRVEAVDLDNPSSSARIRYKFDTSSLSLPFSINVISGEIRSTAVLDREVKASYNMTVIAYPVDQPWRTSNTTVNVSLKDINDNPPIVHSPRSITVPEDLPVGSSVLVINATDLDIGVNKDISFQLISSTFKIDLKTGRITLKKALDREVRSSYDLSISVKDITFETIHDLTVLITDVNDSPPYFPSGVLNVNVSENTAIGKSFGKVTANDNDTRLYAVSFYHIEPRSGYGIFVINSNTGSLSLKKQVKFRKPSPGTSSNNEYKFSVFARNLYRPFYTANASLTIRITDYNDHAPVFTKSIYNVNVLSTASVGEIVATLQATDTEDYGLNAVVNYAVINGNGSTLFRIHADNVKVKASLAAFGNKVLQLIVEARDSGTPVMTSKSMATVTITVVEHNNFPPIFSAQSYQKTVAESYQLYKEIIQVQASDKDSGNNGKIGYYIIEGNADNKLSIGVSNGSIYAVKPLDYEAIKSYTLKVQAKDHAALNSRFSTGIVQIQLTDVNDNKPMFTAKAYEATVTENQPVKTSVFKLSATDEDIIASNEIIYTIIDDASKPYFTIDQKTGLIETKAVIDYEQKSSFNIQILATDNGSPALSNSVLVKVKVVGKNEYPPKFTQSVYNFTVSRSALIGHVIGKVKANDLDKGIDGVPLYLPIDSFSSLPFGIDSSTGDIHVARKLVIGKYTMKLFVKNIQVTALTPGLIDETSIGIEVLEGNEPPSFSQLFYSTTVKENATIGKSVFKVTAIDNDAKSGGQIRYGFVTQQPLPHFSIDAVTGVITVAVKLDRETTPSYNLTIKATDNGIQPASNTTQVGIKLLDVNDMPPKVVKCSGSVYENATINTIAAKAYVQDKDIDPNRGPFNFHVSNSNDFGIMLNSGDLFVRGSLDRESRSVHNISISVTDNGTPSLMSHGFCIIKILDVSDTEPRPRSVRIVVNSLGDYSLGGLLGDVSPVDPDLSDSYTCQLNKSTSLFSFDASSCKLHSASHRNTGLMHVYYSALTHNAKVTGNNAVVDFISLRNATVEKMFAFRLQGIESTISEFTNKTLVLLSDFFVTVSPVKNKILIIGYTKQSKDSLDLLVVMRNNSFYVQPGVRELEQIIKANIQKIREVTLAASLQVPHDACASTNPCLNNGECSKFLKIDNSHDIHSSDAIIFHSVGFNSTFSCRCKPGYHGSRCEYAISKCVPNPCQNGGVCKYTNSIRSCVCSDGFTGQYCESDVDECSTFPCKNNGICQNIFGGYKCSCHATHTGKNCETSFDPCRPSPCLNTGTCSRSGNQFTCGCKYGYKGRVCEISPMTFHALSYLSVAYTSNQAFNVSFEFATYKTHSLLLYGYHRTITGVSSPFVALEIINEYLRFSFSFGVTLKRKTVGSMKASDGNWHTTKLFLSGQKLTISLDSVEDYLTLNEATKSPDLGGAPLFVGGIDSIKPILDRPNQVTTEDFAGCMRNIIVNDRQINQNNSIKTLGVSTGCTKSKSCTGSPCKKGKCVNNWNGFQCKCDTGYAGNTCSSVAKPFTFGGSSFVMFKLKESYRRKLQLAEVVSSRRRRREVVKKLPDSSSISLQSRTRSLNGMILYSTDIDGSFTALYIKDGQVHYRFDIVGKGSGSMSIEKPLVTDGMWHNISLTVGPKSVTLVVDGYLSNHNSFVVSPHKFYSKNTDVLSIAGSDKTVIISGNKQQTFQGCLNNISLNEESLSLQQSDRFNITQLGPVSNSCPGRDVCASSPCVDPVMSYCVDIWEAYNCVHPGKCVAKPCKNNGVCIPVGKTSYNCKCRGNFTGNDCEVPLICLTSPCQSGENCVADSATIYRCVLISKVGTGLGTTYIVLIVVLIIIVLAFIFLLVLLLKRRKGKKARTFDGDFTDSRNAIELKETEKTEFDNQGYESEQSLDVKTQRFHYATDGSEYDNEAYLRDSWKSGLDLISKRNPEFISKSQPVFRQPLPHREATHQKGSNRSLPLALLTNENIVRSNTRLDHEARMERQRNERILQDLQGFHSGPEQYDSIQSKQFVGENGVFSSRNGSSEMLNSSAKKFPSIPKIQLGTTTPPFESGFESTGSDVDSEREQASITDIGMENASSQFELYDLEVVSIGFSEMSWQNDNKSLRDYRRENVDRFRHFAPHVDLYDHGSNLSDRNTRSDVDRLSDVVERDSSSESDGSFTCSEYEYGDERISSNKLKRKRLVFSSQSKHPESCDSDVDSSFRPRRNSQCSSMTSITDIGSINPGFTARTNATQIPSINWDELLNWGMKYGNLAGVYRALASLDDPPRPVTSTSHGHEAIKRNLRLQAESDRDSSAHSSQELHRRPAVVYSATPVHEEEYV